MQEMLGRFVQALRLDGIPVSPPETLDALRAMQLVGLAGPTQLQQALSLVMVKNLAQQPRFDAQFQRFFGSSAAPDAEPAPDEQASPETSPDELQSTLGQQLLNNEQTALDVAIAAALEEAGAMDMNLFTQKGVVGQRVLRALGGDELRDEMLELMDQPDAAPLLETLRQRRSELRSRISEQDERQYLLHGEGRSRQLRDTDLRQINLGAVDYNRQKDLERLIRAAARQLASLHGRRRRITRRGMLDMRKTLAANAAFDGVLFHTRWKQTRIERPKVFVLCDISGSMARYSRFLLLFLYCLQDVLPKVRSFVFTSDLFEVTDELRSRDIDEALALIMKNFGLGSTHYGVALRDFRELALKDVDSRSSVIMLGDARNNGGDGEAKIWEQVYRQAQRVLWLNPEARLRWDYGDSIMADYIPFNSRTESCQSVNDLSRILGSLLKVAR